MYMLKTILFWIIALFFLITNFIRTFIDSSFGNSVTDYFRDFPISTKSIISFIYIAILSIYVQKRELKDLYTLVANVNKFS